MTDPLTAFWMLIAALVMVLVVVGGGVWMCVRAGEVDHPPVDRTPAPEIPPRAARGAISS